MIVRDDDTWAILPGAQELGMARDSVRDAVERAHRWPTRSADAIAVSIRASEKRRAAHAAELAALSRVIVHVFPAKAPRAAVLVDVDRRELTTLVDDQLATIPALLKPYDVLSGLDIRATLRGLGIEPEDRRLAELGPPQKSVGLNSAGRSLKITAAMLVQGSCGISRPLGDPKKLRAYVAKDQLPQLVRRLEADAKALYALHQYGKLHGYVRLRWGFLDEIFPAPWHHRDESMFYQLKQEAHSLSMGLMAVVGSAPGWEEPWSRARRLDVEQGARDHDLLLFDELGRYIDDRDVQLARLELEVH